MARQRRKQAEPEVVTSSDPIQTNKRSTITMAGLSPDQIAALLGKTRTKGDYVVKLNAFITSGEGGICVNEQWVELKDKKATTLKQGFENAKDNKEAGEGSEGVKVVVNEEKVYLINLGSVDAEQLAAAASAE